MSYTHRVEVFRIKELTKHPNADKLELVQFFDVECAVRKGDFQVGDLVAYIQNESVVPPTEQFAFLQGKLRIKPQKLRGRISQGLIIPAPEGAKEGDDVAEQLGITHYDPPEPGRYQAGPKKNRRFVPRSMAPTASVKAYDVEPWFRYADVIPEGTPVVAEEKIHGCNTRVLCQGGKVFVGSRQCWLGYRYVSPVRKLVNMLTHGLLFADNINESDWWTTLDANPKILRVASRYPEKVFYMEMYGRVQDLTYGAVGNQRWLAIFDIYDSNTSRFMAPIKRNALLVAEGLDEYMVPIVRVFNYDKSLIKDMASGKSFIKTAPEGHIREGIVIKPYFKELSHPAIGRAVVKCVSPEYLARGK